LAGKRGLFAGKGGEEEEEEEELGESKKTLRAGVKSTGPAAGMEKEGQDSREDASSTTLLSSSSLKMQP